MLLKIINFCEKTNKRPEASLACIALLFHGNLAEDKDIINYCDIWKKENGDITFKNIRKYIKSLGYIREIVEISTKFNWNSSEKF